MKYKLGKKEANGLYRVIALKSFGSVSKGDIGGFVEGEKNLSQEGFAWVSGDARVYGDARVSGEAWVSGSAWVYGDARVSGEAWVSGSAWVSGDARVSGSAWVSGDAWVYGDARVSKTPLVISGLYYNVTITETHIFIGCQGHTKEQWISFSDVDILKMDGKKALTFWDEYKKHILWLASTHKEG